MLRKLAAGILGGFVVCGAAGMGLASNAVAAQNHAASASQAPSQAPDASARGLMVSDIHFEPFWDPAKVQELAHPGSNWNAILAQAPSADRAERFAALQKTCHARGADTNFPLFESSLHAMQAYAGDARFITVSGDLIAHDFDCKFKTLFPHATALEYRHFVTQTIAFVEQRISTAFPGIPAYMALGNNDSDCGDDRLDAHGAFLVAAGPPMLANAHFGHPELKHALRTFDAAGYYSVPLPSPFEHTRLLVMDDNFMSPAYATCGGKPDPAPAEEQIAWLRSQLEKARQKHEKVWVMAHIPPGINPFSAIRKMANVCAGGAPSTFLRSDAFADTITEYGDVVRLTIFGHTHMDELRLLQAHQPAAHESAVPLKVVPSITPEGGNKPSFVVASVDPSSAILKDYRVISASNETGAATKWSEEYDFGRAYGQSEFSPASLRQMIADFRADSGAKTGASQEYLRNYYPGDMSPLLKPFWPEYTCALVNNTAEGFRSCACGGQSR